jgi:hypothetical protein
MVAPSKSFEEIKETRPLARWGATVEAKRVYGSAEMAGRDGPSRPPGQLSAGAARWDLDRAVIEAQVEARRQARLQREEPAKSAAAAAKLPVGSPPKPRPDVPAPAPQPAVAAEAPAPQVDCN